VVARALTSPENAGIDANVCLALAKTVSISLIAGSDLLMSLVQSRRKEREKMDLEMKVQLGGADTLAAKNDDEEDGLTDRRWGWREWKVSVR
jgi:hypothetical protein